MGLFDFLKKKREVVETVRVTPESTSTTEDRTVEAPTTAPEIREPKEVYSEQRMRDITNLKNDYEVLAKVELYCQIRGFTSNNEMQRLNFFIEERETNTETFRNTMQVVIVLSDQHAMRNAKMYAQIVGEKFHTPVELANFFVYERHNRPEKFQKVITVISTLDNPTVMKNAGYYARLTGKSFDSPEKLAIFFNDERYNNTEKFTEVMHKVIEINKILSDDQKMEQAKALAKESSKTFNDAFELASFYANEEPKKTLQNGR